MGWDGAESPLSQPKGLLALTKRSESSVQYSRKQDSKGLDCWNSLERRWGMAGSGCSLKATKKVASLTLRVCQEFGLFNEIRKMDYPITI